MSVLALRTSGRCGNSWRTSAKTPSNTRPWFGRSGKKPTLFRSSSNRGRQETKKKNSRSAVVADRHDGHVVALRRAGAERLDGGEQRVEHLLRRPAAMRVRA